MIKNVVQLHLRVRALRLVGQRGTRVGVLPIVVEQLIDDVPSADLLLTGANVRIPAPLDPRLHVAAPAGLMRSSRLHLGLRPVEFDHFACPRLRFISREIGPSLKE